MWGLQVGKGLGKLQNNLVKKIKINWGNEGGQTKTMTKVGKEEEKEREVTRIRN